MTRAKGNAFLQREMLTFVTRGLGLYLEEFVFAWHERNDVLVLYKIQLDLFI